MPHTIPVILSTVIAVSQPSGAKLPVSLDLTTIRTLPVQHDGRWPPLETVAAELVESVTGKSAYQGRDPVLWLLAWTFDPQSWIETPLIPIKNAELRAELQLSSSQTVYSYAQLVRHRRLQAEIEHLAHIGEGRKLNPLESKVGDISETLGVLQGIFRGLVILAIPDAHDANGAWRPIGATLTDDSDDIKAAGDAWTALGEAFLADDGPAFAAAVDRLTQALAALPAAYRPDPQLIATELRYNRLRPFHTGWIIMAIGAALAAGATRVRRRAFDALVFIVLIAGFAVLTYGLSMRWQIAGRIPASNMFESLLFLSWGTGAFAILAVLIFRHRIVPLTASFMAALSLFLADVLPLNSGIRPITPVLRDTVWMSIHVPVIMVSYSVLALAVLIAHVQLVAMAITPRRREFIRAVDTVHYWYVHVGVILLLAGIVTGSMWAASSWGRYWGWDPKEVWSLVAFLGYLTILHVRIDKDRLPRWTFVAAALMGIALFVLVVPQLAPLTGMKLLALAGTALVMVFFVAARGPFATAAKSILAFWLIIMTYVGVNYVLGIGLHSYGFGTGAVVRYMFTLGGIELALVAVCSVLYWHGRTRAEPSAALISLPVTPPA